MNNDYTNYLRDFIGTKWLDDEYRRVETTSPLRGAGNHFSQYHPWVHYMYELEYLLRRANIENHDEIVLGKYHCILDNAGRLLKENRDDLVDVKDAQMKLRNPKQFFDFIWELEVRTMLSAAGATASFVNPLSGNTYDGIARIEGIVIPYECKNKSVDNEKYNSNMVFAQVLANRIGDVSSIRNRVIEIEFDKGFLEDIKTITAEIQKISFDNPCLSILDRYTITLRNDVPFETSPPDLLQLPDVDQVFVTDECLKKELYLDNAPSRVPKTKILIKMPAPIQELRNINGVLKKANLQLKAGGIVFLQVPYHLFEQGKTEVEHELSQSFSNISAVKIVAIQADDAKGAVKISRKEDLITSSRAKYVLPDIVKEFLSKPMVFSKYAKGTSNT